MTLVPPEAIQLDFIGSLLASKHRGEQDAVVVDVSFVAKNGDFKSWHMLQDLFHASDTRHAVPDYHKLFHGHNSSWRKLSPACTRLIRRFLPPEFPQNSDTRRYRPDQPILLANSR